MEVEGILERMLPEIQVRKIESLSKDRGYGHKEKGSEFDSYLGAEETDPGDQCDMWKTAHQKTPFYSPQISPPETPRLGHYGLPVAVSADF